MLRAVADVAGYGQFMRTVGVDLSAEARGTGIAIIDWHSGGGRLNEVGVGADDAVVLAALEGADPVLATTKGHVRTGLPRRDSALSPRTYGAA